MQARIGINKCIDGAVAAAIGIADEYLLIVTAGSGDHFFQSGCDQSRLVMQFRVEALDIKVIPVVHCLDRVEFVGKCAAGYNQ